MDTSALEYELPPELIAQRPAERRDESRLLVYERTSGEVRHRRFSELPEVLAEDELVVVNETRVIPARLRGHKPTGGQLELLLVHPIDALAAPAATPADMVRSRPPGLASARFARSRSATSEASASSAPGMSTRNSSPPCR